MLKANLKATKEVQWLWHLWGVADVSSVRDDVAPGTLVSPMTVECAWQVPWWQRFITRLVFRSKWEKPSVDWIIESRKRMMEQGPKPAAAGLDPVPRTLVGSEPQQAFPVREEIGP